MPVIKSLRGEFEALHRVPREVRERLTPVIEPTMKAGDDPPGPRSMLARLGEELSGIFGIDRPFFLDLRWLSPRSMIDLGSGHRRPAMQHVLDACGSFALQPIPVFALAGDAQLERLVATTIGFGRGACLRVNFVNAMSSSGMPLEDQLEQRLDQLDVAYPRADLFLDLGHISQDPGFTAADLARRLLELGDLSRWRTVALAGTVIPPDLRAMPEYTVRELVRREWELWSELGALGETRWPSYADYLIQNPKPPLARAVKMKANIRYSTRDRVLLVRGAPMARGGHQYKRLAGMLVARSDFDGPNAGWGDSQIDGCARGLVLPTRAEDWRAIGTARHLQITTDALCEREVA